MKHDRVLKPGLLCPVSERWKPHLLSYTFPNCSCDMTASCFSYKVVSFSQKHRLMRIFVNSLEIHPSQWGLKAPVLSQVSNLYPNVSLFLASHSCIGWMSKPMLDRVLESRSASEALRCSRYRCTRCEPVGGAQAQMRWDQWPYRGDTEVSVPSLHGRAQWGGHHPEALSWPINM